MGRILRVQKDFTQADGNLSSDWRDLNSGTSQLVVESNAVRGNSGVDEEAEYVGVESIAAQNYASVKIRGLSFLSNSYRRGVILRPTAGSNATRSMYACYVCYDGGGPNYTTRLSKIVNGTETILVSVSAPWANEDRVECECEDDASGHVILRPCRNGTPISGMLYTDTSSPFTTGRPGLYGMSNFVFMDDFEAGDISNTVTATINGLTEAESVPTESATGGANSTAITLKSDASTLLANTTLKVWTRNTVGGPAIDGGTNGLTVTTNGSGVLNVTGLSIVVGNRILTVQDPADPNNSHNYPVTVA
jgi:hypothetical protein